VFLFHQDGLASADAASILSILPSRS
jgi:hypothetical protein